MRAELRKRVTDAVRALNYTPNLAARTLRAGASRMILIDAPHQLKNSFLSALLTGLDDVFNARGYTCIIGSTEMSDARARRIIELAYARQIDGAIVLIAHATRVDGRSILDAAIPVVAICADSRAAPRPASSSRTKLRARRQVEHLVALGHRDLLYVGGPTGSYNDVRRRRGFKRAAEAARLGVDRLSYFVGDYLPASGAEAAKAFVARRPRQTGVVCASDDMAIGFMSHASSVGLRCPDDYSIVGFDGIEYGKYWSPGADDSLAASLGDGQGRRRVDAAGPGRRSGAVGHSDRHGTANCG